MASLKEIVSTDQMFILENNSKIHRLADVEDWELIGKDTVIWRWTHIMKGCKLGDQVKIGQGCFVQTGAVIGNRVSIQNGVYIWDGVEILDDVFIGPNVAFTNVKSPDPYSKSTYQTTRISSGVTIGANATIICPVTIGKHAFIGAGAVVTKDVPDWAVVVGNPARILKFRK
jgi:UDP-2-acetamido-3-amino-2,3-dideoxy-glucuronate N-acetyltransferase